MIDRQRVAAAPRLRLLPQRAAHAEAMYAVLCDPRLYEHENAPPASADALRARYARLESRRSGDGREQWLNWVIEFEGTLIGYVQATVTEASGDAAIAYELGSRWWGRGLASEAVHTMVGELHAHHGVRRLHAVLKRSNMRSMALLERCGFALDAGVGRDHEHEVEPEPIEPDEWRMRRDADPAVCIARESPRSADAAALIDELDAYQRPLYPPESHHGIDADALAAPNAVFAVARDGHAGKVAFGCGAVIVEGRSAELKRMVLRPARRGAGHAEALLHFLRGAAIVRGASVLRLETGIHQHAALRFYERAGFERTSAFGSYASDPLSVFMQLLLCRP